MGKKQSFEVEQKFRLDDPEGLAAALRQRGATERPAEQHRDTYFNHPCRDFRETHEALRVRRVDGSPSVTFKGPKMPGVIKARRELEWSLAPGDPDGSKTEELLELLGFRRVETVSKQRRTFQLADQIGQLVITIDRVDRVGNYSEIELLAEADDVEGARQRIGRLAEDLGLQSSEPRSYLAMLLESPE